MLTILVCGLYGGRGGGGRRGGEGGETRDGEVRC